MSPVIPFNLYNYGMGVTGVKLWHYVLGGFGMIPGITIYCYFGSAISNVADVVQGKFEGGALQIVVLIVGSIFAVVAVIIVSCMAKRAISKVLKEDKEKKKAAKEQEEA